MVREQFLKFSPEIVCGLFNGLFASGHHSDH